MPLSSYLLSSSAASIKLRAGAGIPGGHLEEPERWTVEAELLGSSAGVTRTNSVDLRACPVTDTGGVPSLPPGVADMDELLGRMLEETYKARSKMQEEGANPPRLLPPKPTPACAAGRDQADCHQWPATGDPQQQRPGRQGRLKGHPQQQTLVGGMMQPWPADDASGPADQCMRQWQGGGGQGLRPLQRSRREAQEEEEEEEEEVEEEEEELPSGSAAFRPKPHIRLRPQAVARGDAAASPLTLTGAAGHILVSGHFDSGGGSPSCMHPLAAEVPAGQRLRPRHSPGGVPLGMSGAPLAGYAASPRQNQQLPRGFQNARPPLFKGEFEEYALTGLTHGLATSRLPNSQQQLKPNICAGSCNSRIPADHNKDVEGQLLPSHWWGANSSLASAGLLTPGFGAREGGMAVATASLGTSSWEVGAPAIALPREGLPMTPPVAANPGCGMADSIETLGRLALDPSLSLTDRMLLMNSLTSATAQCARDLGRLALDPSLSASDRSLRMGSLMTEILKCVRDLGQLATDPSHSAPERLQRIRQYSSNVPRPLL